MVEPQKPSSSSSSSTSPELAPLAPFYKEIATLPARQRIDRLLSRKDTMRVVRQMPVPDVLTTINDVGAADALEVIELLSPAQVQGILDLDGWRKDRLDPASIGKWLKVLLAANADRAAAQLRGLDLELLTLLFKVHTRVYDIASGEEPEHEGRHSITPDQRYLIAYGGVGADDETQAALHQVVERLMGRDLAFVLRMCEAVRWELASQLEEDAFRWRNARMADLGFLPQHEAVAIYAVVDPDKPLPKADGKTPEKSDEPPATSTSTDLTTSPLLPWTQLAGDAVLGRALTSLGDDVRDRVMHELMLTANRVHAADGQDSGDTDALKETVRRAAQTIGTGLAYLTRGDEARLVPTLSTTPVMMLFRVGHSLSVKLQTELRHRVKAAGSGLDGRGLLRLDAPLREVVAGFLRPRPLLYGGLLDARRIDYRPVASLSELAAAASALTEAAFRAALLHKLGATDVAFDGIDDADLPAHSAVLVTYLATGALSPSPSLPSTSQPSTTLQALLSKAEASAPLPGAKTPAEARARAAAYAQAAWSAFVAAPSTSTAWIG